MSRLENDLNFIREIIYQFYKTRKTTQVTRIVSKYGLDYDDVFQIAAVAYLKSELNYKSNKGVKFHSFIGCCIKNDLAKINQHFRQKKRNSKNIRFLAIDAQSENESLLAEVISTTEGGYKDIENQLTIDHLLSIVGERERFFIQERYLKDKKQADVAKEAGLCTNSVSRLVRDNLTKIRHFAKEEVVM